MAEIITIEAREMKDGEVPTMDFGKSETETGELTVATTTANWTTKTLYPVEQHFWQGRTLTNYIGMAPNTYAVPRQIGTLPQGVKFGLVYADGHDTTARKFVAAFDTPAGKAYAEAGPVGPVDWDVVEVKLGMATGKKAVYDDPILGGRTVAELLADNVAKAAFSL